jgi:hypothetical protein
MTSFAGLLLLQLVLTILSIVLGTYFLLGSRQGEVAPLAREPERRSDNGRATGCLLRLYDLSTGIVVDVEDHPEAIERLTSELGAMSKDGADRTQSAVIRVVNDIVRDSKQLQTQLMMQHKERKVSHLRQSRR